MEKRDYLKDQIEELGKVIARIVSDFLGLKSSGQTARGIEITNQRFQTELDMDMKLLSTLSKTELSNYLKTRKLTAEHLEILSGYFKEIGAEAIGENETKAKIWLATAVEILDVADEVSETMSFDRVNKKKELLGLLHHN